MWTGYGPTRYELLEVKVSPLRLECTRESILIWKEGGSPCLKESFQQFCELGVKVKGFLWRLRSECLLNPWLNCEHQCLVQAHLSKWPPWPTMGSCYESGAFLILLRRCGVMWMTLWAFKSLRQTENNTDLSFYEDQNKEVYRSIFTVF